MVNLGNIVLLSGLQRAGLQFGFESGLSSSLGSSSSAASRAVLFHSASWFGPASSFLLSWSRRVAALGLGHNCRFKPT
ncbi:hypothetical protein, partial [Solimonas soli]|uniref:hypothetical protein n=1 Tax=Solimonas soli TaxID=413479 RepID=UPI001B7FC8F0